MNRPSRLLEGDVDWPAVMKALTEVGYRGPLSPEIDYDAKFPDEVAPFPPHSIRYRNGLVMITRRTSWMLLRGGSQQASGRRS